MASLGARVAIASVEVLPDLGQFSVRLRQTITGDAARAGQEAGQQASQGVERGGSTAGEGFSQRFRAKIGKVADYAKTAGIAAGGLLGVGLSTAIENENVTAKLQAQLGAGTPAAKAAGEIAGRLYAHNYGENLGEVQDAIAKVYQAKLLPPDVGQAELEGLTGRILSVAGAFDQDVGSVINAISQQLKTGLAPNAGAALDVMTRGFQLGADKSGDLLDTFNEYGVQFQKFGLDAATATGILQQGLQGGARDGDLVADAIKEFSIRAIDGSTATADGFKAIGLNAGDMAAKIGAGGETAKGALDLTLDRLRAIPDPVKRSAAATALFGTQAEDLGNALFSIDPSTAVAGLGQVAGAAQNVDTAMGNTTAGGLEAFKRQGMQALSDVAVKALPPINDVLGVLSRYSAVTGPAVAVIAGLGAAVYAASLAQKGYAVATSAAAAAQRFFTTTTIASTGAQRASTLSMIASKIATVAGTVATTAARVATAAWAAIQWVLNAALFANPIGLIVLAITALVAGIILAWKNSETFRNVVIGAWNVIKAVTSAVFGFVKAYLGFVFGFLKVWIGTQIAVIRFVITTAWNVIKAVTSAVFGFIKSYIGFVIGFLKVYIGTQIAVIRFIITTAWNVIKAVTSAVFGFVKAIIVGAVGVIVATVRRVGDVAGIVGRAFTAAKDAAGRAIGGLLGVVRGIPGAILRALGNLGGLLFGAGRSIIEGLWNGIQSLGGWIAGAIGNLVKSIIPGPIRKVLGINSPSKVTAALGRNVSEGLALGIRQSGGLVAGSAAYVAQLAVPSIASPEFAARPAAASSLTPIAAAATGAGNTWILNGVGPDVQGVVRREQAAHDFRLGLSS